LNSQRFKGKQNIWRGGREGVKQKKTLCGRVRKFSWNGTIVL